MTRMVRFRPQAWINNTAIECDAEGPTDFDVGEIPAGVHSRTYESDAFKEHPNAPQWVRMWHGPFDIILLDDNGEEADWR